MENLTESVAALFETANRMETLADAIAGVLPPPDTVGEGAALSNGGLLNDIDEKACQIAHLSRRINVAIARVSERL